MTTCDLDNRLELETVVQCSYNAFLVLYHCPLASYTIYLDYISNVDIFLRIGP